MPNLNDIYSHKAAQNLEYRNAWCVFLKVGIHSQISQTFLNLKKKKVSFLAHLLTSPRAEWKSMDFVPSGSEVDLDCATHWLCAFGGVIYLL